MEGVQFEEDVFVRGIHVPVLRTRDEAAGPSRSSIFGIEIPSPVLVARSSSTACDSSDANLCEKPAGGNMTTIIACSVA
jgi:hypothetical protein